MNGLGRFWRTLAGCVVVLVLVGALAGPAAAQYLTDGTRYADNRFIVKLDPNAGDLEPRLLGGTQSVADAELTRLNARWGVVKVERLFVGKPPTDKESAALDLPGYWRFWLAAPVDLETLLGEYAAARLVEHVEPVGIQRIVYSPTDPDWPSQWYLRSTAQDHDIDAVEGWDIERGDSTVVLGVTDTGVLYSHQDLTQRVWRNWAEKNGVNGVDDDGNGFVDDSVGWDFVSGESVYPGEDGSTADADPKDFNGHGTHVAGIAAAQTNNGVGVAGIAGGGGTETGCRVMALRIGWSATHPTYGEVGYVGMDYAAQAIDYGRQKGVKAFNCSWGSDASGGLPTAVTAAINAGIVLTVAAGNDNTTSQSSNYLSTRNDCIDVAATGSGDVKASFSNYGTWVDVSAPGVNIYATYSFHYTADYEYLDGTSMAAPCVMGEVGLLRSRNPGLTRAQVISLITGNVDNIYDENPGNTGQLGTGRINVNLALLAAASIVVTSPNGGEVWYTGESRTLTWTSSGVSGNVKLELNRTYPGGAWETILASTTNDGTQAWTVTGTATAARVRVSSVTTPSIFDDSDADFTLATPTVTVLAPNGGETWFVGASQAITWATAGFTDAVKIEINRTYPSATWTTLFASTANDGSEAWTVTAAAGTHCRVRISRVSSSAIADTSDADFTVAQPYIAVDSPDGGELWLTANPQTILWSSAGFAGTVKIDLNRSYPAGAWETLYASTANDGAEVWPATGLATAARVRISSVTTPSIRDSSAANFAIAGAPPIVQHDPLADFAPGTGTVCALVTSPSATVSGVKLFYRLVGTTPFDSLALAATGNPTEYAASLAALSAGQWEYYLRALDNLGVAGYLPAQADPDYRFDVGALCPTELAYDDGSAESFNFVNGDGLIYFQWAVKFGPVAAPYALCGARFAASRSLPDSAHTPVQVRVYLADGVGGMPGTLLSETMTGSVGNVVGGLPAGTNWAEVLLYDGAGNPLFVNATEFYIAIANPNLEQVEAFGRDTTGTNTHRAVFYDACLDQWFSEDNTVSSENAYPGNRLIRARGYSLAAPQQAMIYLVGSDIRLSWTASGAPLYNVYRAVNADGPFSFLSSTSDTFLTVSRTDTASARMLYEVRSATP